LLSWFKCKNEIHGGETQRTSIQYGTLDELAPV
jgi:hypothetical protein